MRHDPERDAATYLVGGFGRSERVGFEQHLLSCDECWQEVRQARQGRAVAELAREHAPGHLRERIRSTLAEECPRAEGRERSGEARPATSRRLRLRALPVAAFAVAASAITVVALATSSGTADRQPALIRAALAAFAHDRLPGREMATEAIPDMSAVGLHPVGEGNGRLAGVAVSAFAYRDAAGRALVIYLSSTPLPQAAGAAMVGSAGTAWVAHEGKTMLLGARIGHPMLILGSDEALVRSAGRILGAG